VGAEGRCRGCAWQHPHDASDALWPGPACRGTRVPPGMHPEVPTPGEPEPSVRGAVPGEALPGLTVVATPRSLTSSTLCSPTQDGHPRGAATSDSQPWWSSVAPRPHPVCGYWPRIRTRLPVTLHAVEGAFISRQMLTPERTGREFMHRLSGEAESALQEEPRGTRPRAEQARSK